MAAPVLTSISPLSGPPGAAITLLGSGFDTGALVGCPVLVATSRISASELRASIPEDLAGPVSGSIAVSVYVQNEDGSISDVHTFTVVLGDAESLSWTTVDAVAAEVPGFALGGAISDSTIRVWMRSVAQMIAAAMLRRGLSIGGAGWESADAVSGMPAAAGVLEQMNRLGAAARLAAAIGGQFGPGEWTLAKTLAEDFRRELKRLEDGQYDRIFSTTAATVETGPQVEGGDLVTDDGDVERAFSREQVF